MAPSLPEMLGGLARTLRRFRERTGYSQERFAARIGLHRTYMGHLERGTANPTVKTLLLVSEGLGISLGELLTIAQNEATDGAAPSQPERRGSRSKGPPLRKVAEPTDHGPKAAKRKK